MTTKPFSHTNYALTESLNNSYFLPILPWPLIILKPISTSRQSERQQKQAIQYNRNALLHSKNLQSGDPVYEYNTFNKQWEPTTIVNRERECFTLRSVALEKSAELVNISNLDESTLCLNESSRPKLKPVMVPEV